LKNLTFYALVGVGYMIARQITAASVANAKTDNNVKAFLALIRKYEAAGRYDVIYGGGKIADFSKHPNVKVPFSNPATGKADYSTAAGAYQINYPTWLTIQAAISLPDFSQNSQDTAAIILLNMRGVTPLIVAGNLDAALQKASGTWASLPYSTSGQAKTSITSAVAAFTQAGGVIV
jgi:lysozyme